MAGLLTLFIILLLLRRRLLRRFRSLIISTIRYSNCFFFTSVITFFFADSSFFRVVSLVFASFVICVSLSTCKIISYVSGSTTEYFIIFFDLFFLFAIIFFIKF